MKVKIISDSASNLYSMEGVDFSSVPLKIITNEKEYVDSADLDVNQMVTELASYKGRSSTACPSIGDYLAAFEGYDEIYCVTIISTLSGSYNSAMTAKHQYEEEHPDAKIFVLDSYSAGPEMKLHLEKLKELVLAGKDFNTVCKEITEYKEKHTSLTFSLESLHNLSNNGRVSPAIAKFASLIGLRMVGDVSEEGQLHPTNKCRGEKKALSAMFSIMKEAGYRGGKLLIDHCYNEKLATALKELTISEFRNASVIIAKTGALCSFYAEKGGLMVAFEV